MKMISLIFVLLVSSKWAVSVDFVVYEGDTIELNCSCMYCINYYYNYDSGFYVKKQFGWETRRIWSLYGGYDYPQEFGDRLNVSSSDASNFTLNITNLQFEDGGAYSCKIRGFEVTDYNIIVIGKQVNFSVVDIGDSFITNNETCKAICMFNMSSHPWGMQYPDLEVLGASREDFIVRNNFTSMKTFELSLQRTGSFKCKVILPNITIPLMSEPIAVILNGTSEKEETYIATRGVNILLSCRTLYPFNRGWMWFRESLFQGNRLTFPVVDCVLSVDSECRNFSKSSLFEDVSSKSFSFLSFTGLDLQSTGTYTCIDEMFTVYKSFNIIVMEKAPSKMELNGVLVENGGRIEIEKSQTAIIACSVFSSSDDIDDDYYPRMIVENAEFVNRTRNGDFLVYTYKTSVTESNSYTCFMEIENNVQIVKGFANYTISIDVFFCPEKLIIASEAINGSIARGSVLSCRTDGMPPVSLTWWSSTNKSLKFDGGPNYADLRVYDKMLYTCQTISKWHQLLDNCKPLVLSLELNQVEVRRYEEILKPIRLGKSVSIECSSYYNRNSAWKWIRNWSPNITTILKPLVDCRLREDTTCVNISISKKINDYSSPSKTRLNLPSTDIDDSGTYTCMDGLRTVVKIFRLDVYACPSKLLMSRENLADGGIELTCTVNANPPVSLIWTLGDESKPLGAGLNTVRVKVHKNGAYKCVVPSTTHPFLGKCGELSLTDVVEIF